MVGVIRGSGRGSGRGVRSSPPGEHARCRCTITVPVWRQTHAIAADADREGGAHALASPPEIAHVFVGEGHRGRGAGTALIRSAKQLIVGRGHDLCVLGVDVDNVAAVRLYERLG